MHPSCVAWGQKSLPHAYPPEISTRQPRLSAYDTAFSMCLFGCRGRDMDAPDTSLDRLLTGVKRRKDVEIPQKANDSRNRAVAKESVVKNGVIGRCGSR